MLYERQVSWVQISKSTGLNIFGGEGVGESAEDRHRTNLKGNFAWSHSWHLEFNLKNTVISNSVEETKAGFSEHVLESTWKVTINHSLIVVIQSEHSSSPNK